jgi:hypothetical protein
MFSSAVKEDFALEDIADEYLSTILQDTPYVMSSVTAVWYYARITNRTTIDCSALAA